jgi:hypothetical protein
MAYPLSDSNKMDKAKNDIVNILKMEGYKIDSGNLFTAFKEAGGEMSDFKPALDELTEEGKIKSDSDGNIMTVEDFQREKSQESDNVEKEEENIESETTADDDNELESIIKLKEETDSWLIDKLKNDGSEEDLKVEVQELRKRVEKLERIIENMTRAFD